MKGFLVKPTTIGNILNRLGYNLKRVLKAKPKKKIKEIDQIFENVWKVNRESDENPDSLRISTDAKAKLNIGDFSRGGKSRDIEAKKAEDHEMNPDEKLVPYGILNVLTGLLTFFFGSSLETSDFIADCILVERKFSRKYGSQRTCHQFRQWSKQLRKTNPIYKKNFQIGTN